MRVAPTEVTVSVSGSAQRLVRDRWISDQIGVPARPTGLDVPPLPGEAAGTWQTAPWRDSHEGRTVMDPHINPPARYGRCGDCGELKHVTPEGVMHEHNRYGTRGTSLVASRCTGSGSRPVDPTRDELGA
jgi:hypothetical protein